MEAPARRAASGRWTTAMVAVAGCASALLCVMAAAAAQGTPAVSALEAGALETGGRWLDRCGAVVRGESGAARPAAGPTPCLTWVQGLLDMHAIYQGLGALDRSDEGFCLSATASVAQAARTIAMYIEARPAAQPVSARMLAYMALREEFPCRS